MEIEMDRLHHWLSWSFLFEIQRQYADMFTFQLVNKLLFFVAILVSFFLFRTLGFRKLETKVT
jgi:hypothetical protein